MSNSREEITGPSGLLALPTELILQVATHVDYRDAIMISQTCRRFFRVIDPMNWPVEDKISLVNGAPFRKYQVKHSKSDAPVLRTLQGHPCYQCFKIKPIERFSRTQLWKSTTRHWWQLNSQFCIDCGIVRGFYTRGMILRIDFERQVLEPRTWWRHSRHERLNNPEGALHQRLICETCGDAQEFEYDPRQCLCLKCIHTPRGLRLERRWGLEYSRWRGSVRPDWECLNLVSGMVGPTCKKCSTTHAFNQRYHRLHCQSCDAKVCIICAAPVTVLPLRKRSLGEDHSIVYCSQECRDTRERNKLIAKGRTTFFGEWEIRADGDAELRQRNASPGRYLEYTFEDLALLGL